MSAVGLKARPLLSQERKREGRNQIQRSMSMCLHADDLEPLHSSQWGSKRRVKRKYCGGVGNAREDWGGIGKNEGQFHDEVWLGRQ